MNIKDWEFKSSFKAAMYEWLEVESPKAVVVIVHGMGEYMGRYDQFATQLNANGYLAIGVDLLANGRTAPEGKLGYGTSTCYQDNVSMICKLISEVKEKYSSLPLLVFGHSYGSLVCQRVIQLSSEVIDGVVLSGSAFMNTFLIKSARILAKLQLKMFGEDKPAKLITKLNFGKNDKVFKADIPHSGWLTRDMDEVNKFNNDPLCDQVFSIGFYYSMFMGFKEIYNTCELSKIKKSLKIHIASGDRDPIGGNAKLVHKLYDTYIENAICNVTLRLYQGARHEILNEINKEEVTTEIIEYYNGIVSDIK